MIVSVSVVLWLTAVEPVPTVPVTVRVYVPAGVPALCVTPPPPPPPPQPARANDNSDTAPRVVRTGQLDGENLRDIQAAQAANAKSATIISTLGANGPGGMRGETRGATLEEDVVVTETVMFVAELPGVRGFGETAQVASDGAPIQLKFTGWLRPPSPPTAKV